jgi:hypothetical protein
MKIDTEERNRSWKVIAWLWISGLSLIGVMWRVIKRPKQ